jgi:CheY-like chemotaxis protein
MLSAVSQDRRDGPPRLVLVADGSAPIRHLLAGKLRQQSMSVVEAVDGIHAVHAMVASRPDSLVVAGNLPRLDGVALVHKLGSVEKTAWIPCVVVLNGDRDLPRLQVKTLRPNVTPVIRPPSLDALCGVIAGALGGHPRAIWAAQEEATGPEALQPGHLQQEVDELEKAFGYFEEVLTLFKTSRLPGPTVPTLLREITDLASDPDAELPRFVKVAEKHQAVALRVLALANSAFYCRAGSPVMTVEGAIVRLGSQKTVAVLQALGMLGYVVGQDMKLRESIVASLQKACFVAHAAEYLASLDGGGARRELFTLGLLHNVGVTFLLYTIALLQEQGRIGALDHEAVITMVASRGPQLNQTIAAVMNLPAEMTSQLLGPGMDLSAAEYPPPAMTVLRAIWIAEQVLDQKKDLLEPTGESASLGLDADVLSGINAKLPELFQVLQLYVR